MIFVAAALVVARPVIAEEAKKVDAVTQASWRELTLEEIISPEELRKLQLDSVDFLLFDARDKKTYDAAHIEGAVLPLKPEYYEEAERYRAKEITTPPDPDAALAEMLSGYPKDKKFVTYCNSGCKASAALLMRIKKLGFADVRAMEDGIQGWEAKGYPIAKAVEVTPAPTS